MIAPNEPAPVPPRLVVIDPGTAQSAVVVYDPALTAPIVGHAILPNAALLDSLRSRVMPFSDGVGPVVVGVGHELVVEMIASYGMAVGAEVFETCVWIGKFLEAWGDSQPSHRLGRKDVKIHLCGTTKAKDPNVRAALLDRFGGESVALARPSRCEACKGKGYSSVGRGKARVESRCSTCFSLGKVGHSGPLVGVVKDALAALAVAVAYSDGVRATPAGAP